MSFHPCDSNASGVERAAVVVYTPSGPLELCVHHFRQHYDAFLERLYLGVDIEPLNLPPMNVTPHWRIDVPWVELTDNPYIRSV